MFATTTDRVSGVSGPLSAHSWLVDEGKPSTAREARRAASWLVAVSQPIVVLLLLAPAAGFANPSGASVLQTMGAAATLLAATIAVMRFQAVRSRASLALASALSFVAAATLLVAALPAVFDLSLTPPLRAAGDAVALTAAALMAWTAFARDSDEGVSVSGLRLALGAVGAAVGVSVLGAAAAALRMLVFGHDDPATFVIGVSTVLMFGIAAVGFASAPDRVFGGFGRWLAIASTLFMWATLAMVVAPTRSATWVGLPEILGVLGMIALAIGAVREVESTRHVHCEQARAEERRWLARELHDHVAQELAFIVGQSRELERMFPEERVLADIGAAAKLALDGSRSTIYGLHKQRSAPTLGGAVEARAQMLARRAGLELSLDVDEKITASAEVEHAVLSIVQEAISNAARHGGATMLSVSLSRQDDAVLLRIADNGCGFEVVWRPPSRNGGLGMWSMQHRAEALGGRLQLTSEPGDGTTIELMFA